MQFKLYILYSAKLDKFYIGHTGVDIAERLRKHNSNHRGFTGKTSDCVIVYTEKFTTKKEKLMKENERFKNGKAENQLRF